MAKVFGAHVDLSYRLIVMYRIVITRNGFYQLFVHSFQLLRHRPIIATLDSTRYLIDVIYNLVKNNQQG